MEAKALNMGWSNYNQVIAKDEYEDVFSFPSQLPPPDFSEVCDFTCWDFQREFGMQEICLDAVPLAEMYLTDPFYPPPDIAQKYAPFPEVYVCNSGSAFGVWDETRTGVQVQAKQQQQQQQQQQLALFHNNNNGTLMFDEELPVEEKKQVERSKEVMKNSTSSKKLSRKIVSQYFYMPITQAARELNVGLTLLKKRCRELGIRRWPHRKLMSLQTLIKNVQELGKEEGEEKLKKSIEILEQEKRIMEEAPDMQLEDKTKRLRQACFKANYKKRKLMRMTTHDSSSRSAPSTSYKNAVADNENTVNCSGGSRDDLIDDDVDEELKYFLSDCFSSDYGAGLMF